MVIYFYENCAHYFEGELLWVRDGFWTILSKGSYQIKSQSIANSRVNGWFL